LPLDSVDSLQWVTALERHFQLELTDEELGEGAFLTLGRMVQIVKLRKDSVVLPSCKRP
jgi:acyl carrier protein